MIARAVLENLTRFLLPAVAGDEGLIPLEALADEELSFVALRTAARRGRLRAVRTEEGGWRSSREWVRTYREDRYSALKGPRDS